MAIGFYWWQDARPWHSISRTTRYAILTVLASSGAGYMNRPPANPCRGFVPRTLPGNLETSASDRSAIEAGKRYAVSDAAILSLRRLKPTQLICKSSSPWRNRLMFVVP